MVMIVFSMLMILAVAGIIAGIVFIGIEGRGRTRVPKFANQLTKAAEHLNGDGEPPRAFSRMIH